MDNTSIRDTIRKMNPALSLNQRAFLMDCVAKCYPNVYTEAQKSLLWKRSEHLTVTKYKWLLALFFAVKDSQPKTESRWLARDKFQKAINELVTL